MNSAQMNTPILISNFWKARRFKCLHRSSSREILFYNVAVLGKIICWLRALSENTPVLHSLFRSYHSTRWNFRRKKLSSKFIYYLAQSCSRVFQESLGKSLSKQYLLVTRDSLNKKNTLKSFILSWFWANVSPSKTMLCNKQSTRTIF